MFDGGYGEWDDVPAAVLATDTPPEDEGVDWDRPDVDAWLDGLAAADPDRAPLPVEVGVDALLAVDVGALSERQLLDYQVAVTRAMNALAGARLVAVRCFAGAEPKHPL